MPAKPSHHRNFKWFWLTGITAVAIGAGLAIVYQTLDRAPGEWLRYAEKRAEGHPTVEKVSKPLAKWLRPLIERPIDAAPLPLNQGASSRALPAQQFAADGRPIPIKAPATPLRARDVANVHVLHPGDDLAAHLKGAQPGDIFELQEGRYPMPRSIRLNQGGTPQSPVTVRAARLGQVVIESTASEGFVIQSPYWIFENLIMQGRCPVHSNCEHAFHVVGAAQGTVIRNNRLEDFNAHIKVNGLRPHWPDAGLIQFNTLFNTTPRLTAHPVTPIDIVAANDWQVLDNHIHDFVKGDGNRISYGVFMKGAGQNGLIARNLIVCTTSDISQPGLRVGASLGGGGTDKASCRDERCITEHANGTIVDNVIAHCNDFGIYINKSNQTRIERNKLMNTYGIDLRYPTSSAILIDNQHDGIARAREGATWITPPSH